MKIFFGFPYKNIMEHSRLYEKTRGVVLGAGGELVADWLEEGVERAGSGAKKSHADTYSGVMRAITESDICIFDVTERTMALGHQLTFALDKGKPTLVLYYPTDQHDVSSLFIGGSRSGFLTLKDYHDEKQLESIVKKFLDRYKNNNKRRFNLAIDQYLDDYLELSAFKTGKTKTDLIKGAILAKMNSEIEP